MKMKPSIAVAATLLGLSAVPNSASAMTLEEALATTYSGNPQLQAARAQLRSTDEQVPQALSGWRPTVTLNGSAGREKLYSNTGITGSSENEANFAPKSTSLTISQPVFNGFRTVKATSAAENTVKAGRSTLVESEQSVLLAAAQAYMDVLRDMAVLELNVNNEQVLRRQLEATQDRFRVGEITRTDVSQAEARHAGAVASRTAAEATLQSTRATFEQVVGVPAENLQWPEDLKGLPTSQDEALSLAKGQQPAVVTAEYTAQAAVDSVGVVRSELLPTVSLNGSVARNWNSSGVNTFSESKSVVASVSVPLYEAGGVYSRLRAAKHSAGQRRLEVDKAKDTARASAVQTWESLQSTRAQIVSITSQVESATVALEGVQREAQVGSRTVLDVLDAEQERLNAQVSLVQARRSERVASFQVLSAVGRLNAQSLGLPVELYDPVKHYDSVRNKWVGSSAEAADDYDRATSVEETN